ncbi:hypothetical protein BFJ69_g17479 [Fusarium oxysporum]|uniref:Intradiol ring-cleavage dioxygenases domain-containing protein n=1 Tax=Fusarium oxysporum TaxID=5507 RepID=A0A420M845_FUSOX|nr:hypothetical protein BFJ69_g17479 [Fusarium oxysporum]
MVKLTSFVAAALVMGAIAHPGTHEEDTLDPMAKRAFLAQSRRGLEACAKHLEARGTTKRAEAHRHALVSKHLKRNANEGKPLDTRDTDMVLATDHHSNLTGISLNTDSNVFFTNTSCILSPDGEIGPFWVKGELVREDLIDDEPGVVNYMHAQFIDINTCEPMQGLYWDVWNCNSTGVYSGVRDSSNGNGDDASNLDRTALRSIQETDEDGIAVFKSIFPGHYSGRATHVHVVAHVNATLLLNQTLSGGRVSHIGQLFFDQDLITQVEATYPYNTSDVDITLNSEDRVFGLETEDSDSDPVFKYVFLGDSIEDGIFSWLTIGVNATATYSTSYAAYLTKDGGVSNSNSEGAGSGGPDGTPPAGSFTPAPSA